MNFKIRELQSNIPTTNICEGFLEIGEEKFILPIYFLKNWEKINQFQVRDDDIFITGHPKTGTTWMEYVVNIILNDYQSDCKKVFSILYLDIPLILNTDVTGSTHPEHVNAPKYIDEANSPRIIKTHLPWFLLPEQIRNGVKPIKIIHCLRNPKDTCISNYHFYRSTYSSDIEFEEFCKYFINGKIIYGPFPVNVKSYWNERERPNLFFVKYSDMKKDLAGTVRKIVQFVGRTATDDQINKAVELLNFESMKKNLGPGLNKMVDHFVKTLHLTTVQSDFVRTGKEGGYKLVMSKELIEEFDKVIHKELFEIGLSF